MTSRKLSQTVRGRSAMIDHVTIRVSNIERAKEFYAKTLLPLGYSLKFEETIANVRVLGFGKGSSIDTWFTNEQPVSGPLHLAWTADTRQDVIEFYQAALLSGGKDNGEPGLRPQYEDNYFGAFAIDPDGNNIEAVCHKSEN